MSTQLLKMVGKPLLQIYFNLGFSDIFLIRRVLGEDLVRNTIEGSCSHCIMLDAQLLFITFLEIAT